MNDRANFLRAIFPDGLGHVDLRAFRALKDRPGSFDLRVGVRNVRLTRMWSTTT